MHTLHKLYWGAFIATVVIVVGAYAVFGGKENTQWVGVGGEDAGFFIEFPKAPEHQSQDIPVPGFAETILQDAYVLAGSEDMQYFFTRSLQPRDMSAEMPETVLQGALQGMLQVSPSNQLASSTPAAQSGQPALRFDIADTSSGIHYEGVITYKENALYQAFVSYGEGKEDTENTERFLNSLAVY